MFANDNERLDDRTLDESVSDRFVSMSRGAAGLIPLGGFIGEIVSQLIPNQRMDRIADYVQKLNEKFEAVVNLNNERLREPERVDLFESGAYQAARALSAERREQIAIVVANGMTGDETARLEAKRLLSIIGEIDDDQIVILLGYLQKYRHNQAFYAKHEKVLAKPRAYIGASQDVLDAHTVSELSAEKLVSLGLLNANYQSVRKGEEPVFDEKTGRLKERGKQLSPLGRLVLQRMGLCEPNEW